MSRDIGGWAKVVLDVENRDLTVRQQQIAWKSKSTPIVWLIWIQEKIIVLVRNEHQKC